MTCAGTTGEVRDAGVGKVYAWTVNDPIRIRHVANQGVDGIVTDEPEACGRHVAALRAACRGEKRGGWGALWRTSADAGLTHKGNNRKSLRGD